MFLFCHSSRTGNGNEGFPKLVIILMNKRKTKKPLTKLVSLIKEAGVTNERIAADSGVTAGALSKYLDGSLTEPGVKKAIRICAVLSGILGREIQVSEVFS